MKRKYRAVLYILASAFCFSCMNAFVRLSGDIPSIQKSFFRNAVAMVFAGVILLRSEEKFRFDKKNLPWLFLRASFGTVGLLCNFYAVDHLALSDASMLNKMSPFFAILFSYVLLKEKLTLFQGLAVAAAFGGSLFIIKPSFTNLEFLPSLVGLAGGIGAGAAYTFVRVLGQKGERGPFIVFFFSVFSCLIVVPWLLFYYEPMSGLQFLYLMGAGLSAAGGQFAITAAYCHAPAKEISVYDYSQILFSAMLGFFLFGDRPDIYSLIGYVIICGMAVLVFLYNTRWKREMPGEGKRDAGLS
ncbi:MAG: DMT family transporter [Lachnospiraceae bacterium]|nr:DMT family transporter [Lachnospiraceae bacterium]